ncbi:MAG: alpha/beta fold hydrolase [Micropepsaceae bacterium]
MLGWVGSRVVAVIALTWLACAAAPLAQAKIPVEEFVKGPIMEQPVLSPSGRYMARAQVINRGTDNEKFVIAVTDMDDPSAKVTGTAMPDGVNVYSVNWANDNRLLVSGYSWESVRIIALDRDGKNLKSLFNNKRLAESGVIFAEFVHPLPKEPDYVLMGTGDDSGYYNLYRVNVNDGSAEIVNKGTRETYRWLTDLEGVARVRLDGDFTTDDRKVFLRRGDSDQWDLVARYTEQDVADFSIVGFADDPRLAYAVTRNGGDKFGIYEYNLVTRSLGRLLFQDPNVDLFGSNEGAMVYDPYTTKFLGLEYVDDVWVSHYLDSAIGGVQSSVEGNFLNDSRVSPVSWSEDRKRFVFDVHGPKNPGTYYYVNLEKRQLSLIGKIEPSIPESELGDVAVIKYPVRDGSKIPGYLTYPIGKGKQNLPMVVLPHGGPEARDLVDFDQYAQFLANRGYVVFQPNFRGSGGYGDAYAKKGHRQWGRLMQDDVTDGVKALIKDGTADPNRICIVGASYGGYAALAGGAFTPDLYKCVVSIAGVADIPQLMHDEKIAKGADSEVYKYWMKWLGDPQADLAEMKAFSPALNASKFQAPVLLMHGLSDRIVLPNQSNRMEKALKAAGKQVEYLEFPHQGHPYFGGKEANTRFYTELEKFLTAHIGN